MKLPEIILALFVAQTALDSYAQPASMTIRDFAERDTRPVETLTYKKVDDQNLRLLICKPDDWEAGKMLPAMVWIHGGGWVSGRPDDFIPQLKYSAARGAVGFAIQYRLLKPFNYRDDKTLSLAENQLAREAKMQAFLDGPSIRDCIDDCEDAIRYIRNHAHELGVDPEKIIVIGDSAGGHLAACLGTLASNDAKANAVIDCNGITDLTKGDWNKYIKPGDGHDTRAQAVSPFYHINNHSPPFLVLHGSRDSTVKLLMVNQFQTALKEAGVDTEYKLYDGAQHAFIVYGYSATLEEITQAIFDLDSFLVQRNLLEGSTSITMPEYPRMEALVSSLDAPFNGPKAIEMSNDFPGFLTISLRLKPEKKFNGTLIKMPGKFGFSYEIHNGKHDFKALRMRQHGDQIQFKPEIWQDVTISMRKDCVRIQVEDQVSEVPNDFQHAFIGNQIVFGDGLEAEIKDIKIRSLAK